MAPFHQWAAIKDRHGRLFELFNGARTAAYLSELGGQIDGLSICDILEFGGCENYTYFPRCDSEGGYIDLSSTASNTITVPDSAALDVTGDITLIAWSVRDDWVQGTSQDVFGKGNTYRIRLTATNGYPTLEWRDAGSVDHSEQITTPLPVIDGSPLWLAMDLDINDGAGQHIVRAHTSHDGVNWVQHGVDNVNAGTTTIIASTNVLNLNGAGAVLYEGQLAYAEVRSGLIINGLATGTSVFKFDGEADLVGVAPAATSFVASSGQTVTVNHAGGTPNVIVPFLDGDEWLPQTYDTPVLDEAPWYNANYPESADALGFFIEEWTGLDDRHITRPSSIWGGYGGGETLGSPSATGRDMALNLILFGLTEEAVDYLFRWLGSTLTGVCHSCAQDSILIRRFCGDTENPEYGVAELRKVGMTRGLAWEGDIGSRGHCQIRRASVILTAGDPCMYLPDTDVEMTSTDVNADLIDCFENTPIDPDREICRPSCSELVESCRAVRTIEVSPMAAMAPIVTLDNNQGAEAFPFRVVVYADPLEIGWEPNPCGLQVLGEIYVRAMPSYSTLTWDVLGRDVRFRDATTGDPVSTYHLIEPNDPPRRRFFALPCSQAHIVMEPATMCVDDLGSEAYEAGGVEFNPPMFPWMTVTVGERISCP